MDKNNKTHTYAAPKRLISNLKMQSHKVKEWKKILHANEMKRKLG